MAVTDINIAQQAAYNLGLTNTISSLSSPSSSEETIFASMFDRTIYDLQAMFDWSFLIKRVDLTEVTTADIEGWGYGYSLPSDFGRAIRIETGNRSSASKDRLPYRLDYDDVTAAVLLATDEADAELVYIIQDKDPDGMPEYFHTALAWKLAYNAAMPITGDVQITRLASQEYEHHYQRAICSDFATRSQKDQEPRSPLIDSRA